MQEKKDQKGILEVRELALNIVFEVMEKGAYANLTLDKTLRSSRLSHNDRNLLTEIVNGSIRMVKHLDWVLNLFLEKPIQKQNPWLRNILRIAAYQLLFMERIPDYAAVNNAVNLCRKRCRALAGVCNGVLRNMLRKRDQYAYPSADSLEYLAVFYSQPEWLVKNWLEEFDRDTTQSMLIYMNKRAGLCLRTNEIKAATTRVMEELERDGVTAQTSPIIPWSIRIVSLDKSIEELNSYQKGYFYVQNEASMLAGAILDPQPGEQVLDLCCGVGGKTTHFAERMHNKGSILAIDLYEHKLSLLKKNCRRLGITIVEAQPKDILAMENHNRTWPRVFLDVPCSGLGVLNRRSDSRWKKEPDEILELNQLQHHLIQKAGQMVEPGGIMVYSTCTVNPLENESVVKHFLENHSEFKLEAINIDFFPLDKADRDAARQGLLTLLPGKYDTDGMFYASLRRS